MFYLPLCSRIAKLGRPIGSRAFRKVRATVATKTATIIWVRGWSLKSPKSDINCLLALRVLWFGAGESGDITQLLRFILPINGGDKRLSRPRAVARKFPADKRYALCSYTSVTQWYRASQMVPIETLTQRTLIHNYVTSILHRLATVHCRWKRDDRPTTIRISCP